MAPDWENPHLTGQNNEAPHATMVVCPDAATARGIGVVQNSERVKSPFCRSLNGDWKYHSLQTSWRACRISGCRIPMMPWGSIIRAGHVEIEGHGIPIM